MGYAGVLVFLQPALNSDAAGQAPLLEQIERHDLHQRAQGAPGGLLLVSGVVEDRAGQFALELVY
jgi:hypothetical protein